MKQKHNNKLISGTNISIKEFKELAFEKFKAYPLMCMNYQKNQFEIVNTFYENINITQNKLISFATILLCLLPQYLFNILILLNKYLAFNLF